ncbi:MAG: hypothetical protein OHK0046_14030 [Anaerolineae bacterium]
MILIFGMSALLAWFVYQQISRTDSNNYIRAWLLRTDDTLATNETSPCVNAPFLLPSPGFIGLLWRDPAAPYTIFRRHTGIDVFGAGEPGTVPVFAVYDGYLTRENDWLSTVIIRHDDPLEPGRTIWTYYTHMANRPGTVSYVSDQFPPGTEGRFVEQGTLLGYQGEYAGSGAPIAMHVHMSIVTSDSDGQYRNEAVLGNTLDPSPYFGLPLNIGEHPKRPIQC